MPGVHSRAAYLHAHQHVSKGAVVAERVPPDVAIWPVHASQAIGNLLRQGHLVGGLRLLGRTRATRTAWRTCASSSGDAGRIRRYARWDGGLRDRYLRIRRAPDVRWA